MKRVYETPRLEWCPCHMREHWTFDLANREVPDADESTMMVRLMVFSGDEKHTELTQLRGKRVRVTIETIEEEPA